MDFDEDFNDYFSKRRKLNNFLSQQQQQEEDRNFTHISNTSWKTRKKS